LSCSESEPIRDILRAVRRDVSRCAGLIIYFSIALVIMRGVML